MKQAKVVWSNPRLWLWLLLCAGLVALVFPARPARVRAAAQDHPAGQSSPDGVWQDLGNRQVARVPGQPRAYQLNQVTLARLLSGAPREDSAPLSASTAVITLPLPEGSFSRFQIEESSNLTPTLAARFPAIKSYRGQSLDNPATTARFDLTPSGFHAFVLRPAGAVTITPAAPDNPNAYLVAAAQVGDFDCEAREWVRVGPDNAPRIPHGLLAANGATRRNYRIALATTGQYYQAYGGNDNAVVASLNAWLNAINAIYEKELAVHLNLVDNTAILYTDGDTDPFTNSSAGAMSNEVRPVLRDNVGQANYDVGHVLGSGGGGVAYVGVICQNGDNGGDGKGPLKGGGATRVSGTAGTGSSVAILAHELGHQFGSQHNFNGTSGSCGGGRRNAPTAYEVGSGSTLMSYAGICDTDNLTNSDDLRFHAGSTMQILAHLNGSGGACANTAATGNTPPTVMSGGNFTIPKQTPFTLTAAGNDVDAPDVPNLTYAWDQLNAGGASYANPPYGDQVGDPNTTTRPLFRSYAPAASPARTFPSLTYILNNANVPPLDLNGFKTGEALPSVARTLTFRVTVRDNRAGNGGINDADATLTVDGNTGPFAVTSPNGGNNVVGGAATAVSWNVAGSNGAPVNTANVKISLSTDGGNTFPTVLTASTPNDGNEAVIFPNGLLTTTARLKIEAVGNIFFDISDANFNLTPGDGCPAVSALTPAIINTGGQVVVTGINFTGVTAVNFTGANVNCPSANCTVNSNTQITLTVPAGATTGPLTIVKAVCNNLQTAALAICPNPPVTLSYDSGVGSNCSGVGAGGYYVVRVTPAAYPATLSQVIIEFDNFQGIAQGAAFTILTATNPSGSTNLNGLSFQTRSATVGPLDTFASYAVTPLTINAGDFVVGFSFPTNDCAGLRDGTPTPNRSYSSNDGGATFSAFASDLLIRAQVFTGNCAAAGNSAPSFTPAAIGRQQCSAAGAAVTIGTVTDNETAAGSLTVTQIAGGTATGITVSNIVNTNGTISAQVSAACGATSGTVRFQVSDGSLTGTGDLTVNVTATLNITGVMPPARRASGGQPIKLTGTFANLSTVLLGGVSASWAYSNGTSEITVTTPAHAVGAVSIELTHAVDGPFSKTNAFAYLPTVFTDDTLVAGVTTAKAQHVLELRQAVDALRLVAGLGTAPWTDPTLSPSSTVIKAVHITELRTYLESVAALLGYAAGSYTDPGLGGGFVIKRVHIEELRQRIRTIAG